MRAGVFNQLLLSVSSLPFNTLLNVTEASWRKKVMQKTNIKNAGKPCGAGWGVISPLSNG